MGTGVAPAELTLDLGELHPSSHGAFQLACEIRDGIVTAADPRPGLLHRGTEKLLEARDYRQALMLADRHDWLGAITSEVTLALAVEDLLGLQVPPRATWLRTLLCELTRLSAALAHLTGVCTVPPRGRLPGHAPGSSAREAILDVLESYTGGRIHPMITRIGGLALDIPEGWLDTVDAALATVEAELPDVSAACAQVLDTAPVAVLTREDAIAFGVSGPVGRASGLDRDLRRDEPVLAYAELRDHIRVATRQEGDAAARYGVLLDQVSLDIPLIRACMAGLPDGPVDVPLPKVVRAPEGTAYARLESAIGIAGAYVVSTGDVTPWRVRLRTASFANVQAMSAGLPGTPLSELALAVGSFLFIVGDVDH